MTDIPCNIKLFAFDLDGTLYVGENEVDGAARLVERLRKKYKIAFFTNGSARTVGEVHKKLERLGFRCEPAEIYTSSSATVQYLKEQGIDNLYVVGSESFRRELENGGLRIADDSSAMNLVVGLDSSFNYEKIAIALAVLRKGGKFITCNTDSAFPVGPDKYMPGCGAMVGAISASAKKGPDFIVGKPNTYILSKIAEDYKVEHDEIIVVGDSYESDILMALAYKSRSILIRGGDHVSDGDVLVVEDINQIWTYIREG